MPDEEHLVLADGSIALTVPQAAAQANVKAPTVYSWIRRFGLQPAAIDGGRKLYRLSDIARVEMQTRKSARRNVGLRTVATQEIADDEAVLARLECGHLKILSKHHAPTAGRPVACFECAASQPLAYIVTADLTRQAA